MVIAMIGSPDSVAVGFLLLLVVIRMVLLLFDLCVNGIVSVLLDLRIIRF